MASEISGSAVVTGAGRGIGRALALTLADQGYPVVLQSRTADQLAAVQAEVEARGGRAQVLTGDVGEASAAEALVARAEEAFGPVAVAVACAGQARSVPIMKLGPDELDAMLRVNTFSVLHLIQAAARSMLTHKTPGRIVAVASTAAVKPFRYTAAYTAAKHAALALVKTAALELAKDGITVNAICPGWVDTALLDEALNNIATKTGASVDDARARIERMIPMGHILTPDEVAAALSYLVSPGAGHMTGQAIVIDGGETL